jgi:DNA polymerase II small subunit/DNA polymerase delta subunit B
MDLSHLLSIKIDEYFEKSKELGNKIVNTSIYQMKEYKKMLWLVENKSKDLKLDHNYAKSIKGYKSLSFEHRNFHGMLGIQKGNKNKELVEEFNNTVDKLDECIREWVELNQTSNISKLSEQTRNDLQI